jgi:hypothetical protein
MNAKQIFSYIITGFVCFFIGGSICGIVIYQYTSKGISKFNQHVKNANEYLRSIETGFYETRKFISEAIDRNNRIEQYNQELASGNSKIRDKIYELEKFDRGFIERLEKYIPSK